MGWVFERHHMGPRRSVRIQRMHKRHCVDWQDAPYGLVRMCKGVHERQYMG